LIIYYILIKMKNFLICAIICVISPFLFWGICDVFSDEKSSNIGLILACIAAWIATEIITIIMMIYIADKDPELKKFFS